MLFMHLKELAAEAFLTAARFDHNQAMEMDLLGDLIFERYEELDALDVILERTQSLLDLEGAMAERFFPADGHTPRLN